jgi:integrase
VSEVFLRRLRRLRRYGLPPLTLTGLRHTWATLALEQGIYPRVDEAAQLIADLVLDA